MKRNIFVAGLLLFIIGCTSQQSDQLTQQQKDQIKSEVKVVFDSLMAAWQRLDGEAGLACYSPDVIAVGDSSIIGYQAYKKKWLEDLPKFVTMVKWTSIKGQVTVLSKDLVLSTGFGKLEMSIKTGDKVIIDPQIYTNICKKFGNQWKIIYEHQSGIPMIQKATKK
jgi:ketosteroid isomerase-like protein